MLPIMPNAHFTSPKPKFLIQIVFVSNVNIMAVRRLLGHSVYKSCREQHRTLRKRKFSANLCFDVYCSTSSSYTCHVIVIVIVIMTDI